MKFARTTVIAAAAALTGLMLTPVHAEAAVPKSFVIDFTGETDGTKPNGYSTPGAPGVLFFDTSGANLGIYSNIDEVRGTGLAVQPDDASALEIRLAGPTNAIQLAFGNDDPTVANVTDQAQLTLFRGATKVGEVTKNVNANNLIDQKIAFSGAFFNRVQFQYVDAAQSPLDLIETVDDIKLGPLCTVTGTNGANRVSGTAGSDVLCGMGGNDTINGRGGADLILAGPGNDKVNSGGGGDRIVGDRGNDRIKGAGGADVALGGGGKDALFGGAGRDLLNGGAKRDTCDGGSGRDRGPGCEVRIRIP